MSILLHPLDSSQETCIQWMLARECDEDVTKGGILAEDAGFGKTRVACELIARARTFPCLIVVPRAVLDSEWQTTIDKVTGIFPLVVHGKSSLRYISDLGKVVLTTHATLRSMVDAFCEHKWSRVIIDEAHLLRNPKTQLHKACKRVLENAEFKWLITATPVQNHDSEMISLAELVGLTTHQVSVVRDLIMYRTAAVPATSIDEDTISIVRVTLDQEHMDMYKSVGAKWKSVNNIVKTATTVMEQVLRMRQVATHPRIAAHEYSATPAKFKYVLKECERLSEYLKSNNGNGGGIVVFCNWTAEMDLLETFIVSQKNASWHIERLEGDTPQSYRDLLFYKLRANKFVDKVIILLCQIGCAACGLNLQYAFSTVIIMRPQWNPVTEFQAVRRVVRRGQTHDVVRVSRLVAIDTIDENILDIQKEKVQVINRSLMDDIVGKMLALSV